MKKKTFVVLAVIVAATFFVLACDGWEIAVAVVQGFGGSEEEASESLGSACALPAILIVAACIIWVGLNQKKP